MMIYNNKVSHRTKSISLKNEPCLTGPNFVNYHSFIFSLDRCNGSCNAIGDLSSRICVPSNFVKNWKNPLKSQSTE